MKAHLTRRYRFSASHRLHCEAMSQAENLATYGKCNNPHGHGHNYALEVTVSGGVAPGTGMVCNLADLDGYVNQQIIARYDIANLNLLEEYKDTVPTTENVCMYIFAKLKEEFRHAKVEKIRIEETLMNSFEYAGGEEPAR